MKTAIILVLAMIVLEINGISQSASSNKWIKNPSTSMYSLKYEKKMKEDFFKETQEKYTANVDINELVAELKSDHEDTKLSAIWILGLLPNTNQTADLENLLVNDPSNAVRMACVKSLKYLKSTKSIPVLITGLNTQDTQLKLEIALTLASLGEKTESFKALQELGAKGEWKITLDTHLGYLDIATNDAIAQLEIELQNENPYVSVDAAIILAELGYFEEAFPTLRYRLNDADKYIRMSAIRGLAYIGNSESIELIKSMLDDNESIVRERSKLILGNCNLL